MGFWDAIAGRTRPKQANLDSLFLVPSAAITLQTTIGLTPTGDGSVCFRAADGVAFDQVQTEIVELLRTTADLPEVRVSTDSFGYSWIEIDREPGADVGGLCTGLHAVNTSLESQGFGPGLLCTVIGFDDTTGRKLGLVYLYKQGTFYPFAPTGPHQRDNLLEVQVRDVLKGEIPIEKDLSRWLAVWGAPGL
jgi:PspA associated protein B